LDGNRDLSIRLAAAAATHQVTSGAGLGAILNIEEGRIRRELLTDQIDQDSWAEGETMTIEQAVALALGGGK
jgi:hypothetical protein